MERSAADTAYNYLHDMISNGAISPGQQIVENDIAKTLGISRTPVREALRRLQQEGLVEIIRNKGCFLKKSNYSDLADGWELISLLQAMASRRLAINYMSISKKDISFLNDLISSMDICLEQHNIREWIEKDLLFHQKMIEMVHISSLQMIYKQLSVYETQVLWLITPFFVDQKMSSDDHKKLLDYILNGDSEKAFSLAREHHMRTSDIIRKLDFLGTNIPLPGNLSPIE